MDEGTLEVIYNNLFAGKTLSLTFSSEAQALTFRTKLYRYKTNQDMLMLAGELIESKQALSFTIAPLLPLEKGNSLIPEDTEVNVTIYLEDKKPARIYSFTIIDTESEELESNDGN